MKRQNERQLDLHYKAKQDFYYDEDVYGYNARYTLFFHPSFGEKLHWHYRRFWPKDNVIKLEDRK